MKKSILLVISLLCMIVSLRATETTLFEGETTLAWGSGINIDAAYVQQFKAGDQIAVTVSSKEGITWPQVSFRCSSSLAKSNQLKNVSYNSETDFPCTKTWRLSQADVDTIHMANSLYLRGNVPVTKVVWIPFDNVLCNENEINSSTNWAQYCNVDAEFIPLIHVGDTLAVTIASKFDGQTNLQLHYRSSVNAASEIEHDQYNIYYPEKVVIPSATSFPYVHKHAVTRTDSLAMAEKNSLFLSGCNINVSKFELIPFDNTITIRTTMWEGSQVMGWSQLCSMASYISQIAVGDSIYVHVSEKDPAKDWQQVRVAWSKGYVGFTCYNDSEFPREYGLQVVDTMVAQMKASGKLYLSGTGVTVTKVVLVHKQTISPERGDAVTTLWSGSQSINWSGTNEWKKLEATEFTEAKAGYRLRMNFANMQLGAQGRIIDGTWRTFPDADSYEKLPSDWGDYFEFTLTQQMVDTLQERGLIVSGIGYTLTSIQLINPMREYVVTTTFDTNDIRAWETSDGTPNLTVTFTNYDRTAVSTSINVSLRTDMFVDYNTYSQAVELAAGETKTVSIEFPDLLPGFYRMAAKANNKKVCTYVIGYNPTAIISPDDSQEDFADFWNGWLTQLAAIPVAAELTLLEGNESDARNIYEVKYQSVPETVGGEPVFIYGYYAEPKTDGSYPCIIHFHGTDKSGNLTKPSATETGWCEFRFSARGQTLDKAKNGSEKYRTNPEDESSVDFYAYRLGDNDEHYYRYVYLDTRRAVDFVRSQAKVNKKNIFAAGGSQGGCLTYVCAALSNEYIRAIAPSITGHADFVHTMEIVGWPTNVFNNWINANYPSDYETGKSVLLAHQSYFDTKNFAKWITCPVITNFSLQDQTDGPHLNIAPYNLLTQVTDKEYSINPFKGHATADNWSTTYMEFFNARIDNTPDVPTDTEEISKSSNPQTFKSVRDGQLIIFRDGKEFSILGQIIK